MKEKFTLGHPGSTSEQPTAQNDLATNDAPNKSRRCFVKTNLLGLVLAPIAGLQVTGHAWSRGNDPQSLTPASPRVLDPNDSQAMALHYTPISSRDGQSCSNCQLYSGTRGEKEGACAIFSYRLVANGEPLLVKATGWCQAWGPRQPV